MIRSKIFLIKHARHFMMLAMFLCIGVFCLAVSGCGVPTWLSDANGIIGLVGTSITAIGSFIAGLTGNVALAAGLAIVSTWIGKIETGISDLETLITQYNDTPNAGTLADIEAALADITANLQQDFTNTGLPTSILSVIAGFAGIVLSQLEAWGSLIPAIKAAPMATLTLKVPYTKAEYKALINNLFSTTHTGDPEIDAALAKVKKI